MRKNKYEKRADELITLAMDIHENFMPEKLKALRALCKQYHCNFDIEQRDGKTVFNTRFWLFYHANNTTYIFDAFDIPDGDLLQIQKRNIVYS